MADTLLHNETIYNTYEDVIDDWDRFIKTLFRISNINHMQNFDTTDVIKDLSGFPIGKEAYLDSSPIFKGSKRILSDYLDKMPHGIIDKKIPGIGATTLEIKSRRNSIIVLPTKALAFSKYKIHPNTLYVGSAIEKKKGTSNAEIKKYLNQGGYKTFLVVADSLKRLLGLIKEENYSNYFLMVDEIDVLQSDNNYRPQLEDVVDYYLKFPPKNRCMVTATMRDFSNPQLEHECRFDVTWICDAPRAVKLLHTDNITRTVVEEILKHSNEKIFIAYNSIVHIREIILELEEEIGRDCGILCSEASIREAGAYYTPQLGNKEAREGLPKRINFATCCYFTGIDIQDKYHLISVSDTRQSHSILSIGRMTQIYGRCRTDEGVLSETIVYNIFKKEKVMPSFKGEEYCKYLIHKAEKVLNLIDSADKLSENNEDLKGLFDIVKEAIKNHARQQTIGEAPIELTRLNIDGRYVPAYFNIDYLQEKKELYQDVYTSKEIAEKEISKSHCIVTNSVSTSYNKTDSQTWNEKDNRTKLKTLNDEYIQEAINDIKKWKTSNLLDDKVLQQYWRVSRSHKKIFYERVIRLYRFVDLDSLLYWLWEIRNKNNKAFKTLNNAILFWALADNHPLKQSLNDALKDRSKLYSSDELYTNIVSPIIKYHTHQTINKHKAVNLVKAFYEVKRTKDKGVNKYQVISENPYYLKVHGDRIPYEDDNLLEIFMI